MPSPPDRRTLRRLFDQSRARWPGVHLAFEPFAERLRGLGGQDLGARPGAVDLFLAIACDEDRPGAWQLLETTFAAPLQQLLVRAGVGPGAANELVRELPGELVTDRGTTVGHTRLSTFDGSGPLGHWLGVIVLRKHARRCRGQRTVQLPESADPSDPQARDATDDLGDAETGQRFGAALHAALAAMTERERLALLYRYQQGLAQTEMARLMAIGEPRVSRLLAAAVDKVRHAIEQEFPREGWRDLGRLWRALHEAVARGLATPANSGPRC